MHIPKNAYVCFLLLVGFVGGMARQLGAPGQDFWPMDIPFVLLSLLSVLAWYHADSDQQRYRRSPMLNVMIVGIMIIGLPYYFFRSRGFLRGLVASLVFVAVCLLYFALEMGGEYTAYYGWQKPARETVSEQQYNNAIARQGNWHFCGKGNCDTPPKFVHATSPIYPAAELREQRSGDVSVLFDIEPSGEVSNVRVESATSQAFADAAVEAVKQWKFKPAMLHGSPVKLTVREPVSFEPVN